MLNALLTLVMRWMARCTGRCRCGGVGLVRREVLGATGRRVFVYRVCPFCGEEGRPW